MNSVLYKANNIFDQKIHKRVKLCALFETKKLLANEKFVLKLWSLFRIKNVRNLKKLNKFYDEKFF